MGSCASRASPRASTPAPRSTVELLRDAAEIAGTIVAIGSHDLALDLLASHLRRFAPDARLASANVGSLGGLLALKRGEAHLAGSHLLDEATGEYNRPFVERLLPGEDLLLVNLAYREQGLIVPPGNPHGIRDLADLARPGVRFVNRQKGAGTRVLLDYHLQQRGIQPEQIPGYEREEYTHMAVAAAVLSGTRHRRPGHPRRRASAGARLRPAVQASATTWWCRAATGRAISSQPLRSALASAEYRQAVLALGGYDVTDMGKLM